tara:strand:- start:4524 stop:6302 length:1779 start_codon:yes stop_codon:yes gene_type:complete
MFLPFLPLIVASTSLTLLAGVLERPEPWLKMSIWIVLPAILAFSVIVAQLRQNISLFSRAELTLFTEQEKPSSSKLTSNRIGILIIWLSVVYGEHLDLRIAEIFEKSMAAETISFGVLLLVYWLADALAAVPVYRWNSSGVNQKFKGSTFHLRLQLPILALIFIQLFWIWIINMILPEVTSNWTPFFEILSSLILLVLIAPVVIVKSWGAQAIEKGSAYESIRNELEQFRTPVAGILCWPDTIMPHSTAGVIGLIRGFRYLLISTKLLKALSNAELRAVIAHESEHIRRHHLFYYLIAVTGLLGFFALAGNVNFLLVFTEISQVSGLILGVSAIISVLFFVRFGIGFLSQNFERQADGHSFERFGITPISTALLKVSWLNGINPEQDNWHHYGVRHRIDYLSKCLKKPEMIQKHNRRVTRIKIGCALMLVGLLGANIILSSEFIKINALSWKLERSNNSWKFEDASLLTKMGDLLYFQDRKNQAEIWYRRALELNPGESRTLNNLAWLLTETHLGDQKRLKESMELAQKALAGKKTAFIWDTLAEAYFRNGLYEKAADAAHNALERAEEGNGISVEADLDYYRKRFKQMAGE